MKIFAGIWVDHKKAVIATIKRPLRSHEGEEETTLTKISSNVERKVRLSGGSRTGKTPWGPQDIAVDGKIEARQKQQLKTFYHQIFEAVKDADKILIMGPGEAKHELKKEVEKLKSPTAKIVGLQTIDKVTDKQFTANVHLFFRNS